MSFDISQIYITEIIDGVWRLKYIVVSIPWLTVTGIRRLDYTVVWLSCRWEFYKIIAFGLLHCSAVCRINSSCCVFMLITCMLRFLTPGSEGPPVTINNRIISIKRSDRLATHKYIFRTGRFAAYVCSELAATRHIYIPNWPLRGIWYKYRERKREGHTKPSVQIVKERGLPSIRIYKNNVMLKKLC